jgi:hypothetical protein
MAHAHRRVLHRRAAGLFADQTQTVKSAIRLLPLLQEQAQHWERVVAGFRQGRSYGQRQKRDLEALAAVLGEAAKNSQALGDIREAFKYQVHAERHDMSCG